MNLRKLFLNYETLIFVAGQVFAGGLNYLFQIHAARSMAETDFGSWSRWLAQFSVACFVGVWLQSMAAISDMESRFGLRKCRSAVLILFGCLVGSLFLSWSWLSFAAAWGLSLLSGFLFGANLRKKNMKLLALVSVVGALSRFCWVFFDKSPGAFYTATLVAPFFSCGVFLLFSKSMTPISVSFHEALRLPLLLAALSLAFFSAWIPQTDILMFSRILTQDSFGMFAKVALLSKAFFFGFQILAQMLLAHQVQSPQNRLGPRLIVFFAVLGALASLVGAGVAQTLQWPVGWAFLSLFHITTLCLLYICIQDLAARQRGFATFALCGLSVLVAILGSSVSTSAETYWALVIVAEFLAVAGYLYKLYFVRLKV